jgi:hypothetical protein
MTRRAALLLILRDDGADQAAGGGADAGGERDVGRAAGAVAAARVRHEVGGD